MSTFVIAFDCPGPDWLDAERSQEIVLVPPPSKVFLTETHAGSTKPGELWASNYFLFPQFKNLPVVSGSGYVESNRANRILFDSDDFTAVQAGKAQQGDGRSLVLIPEGGSGYEYRYIYLYPDAPTTTTQYAASFDITVGGDIPSGVESSFYRNGRRNFRTRRWGSQTIEYILRRSRRLLPQRIELREQEDIQRQPGYQNPGQYAEGQFWPNDGCHGRKRPVHQRLDPDAHEQDLAFWDGDTPNTDEFGLRMVRFSWHVSVHEVNAADGSRRPGDPVDADTGSTATLSRSRSSWPTTAT